MTFDLPLDHKRIVVTRAEEQSDSFVSELERLGAHVLCVPMIKIEPARVSAEDAARITGFQTYDVAIFTSVNAVRNIRPYADMKRGVDGRPFVVAIGKKTAESIRESGVAPDFVPDKFNSAELMKSLDNFDWNGKRVLIPKGSLSGSDIACYVALHGGTADEVVVYNTLPTDSIDEELRSRIVPGEFDAVVFFSPSQIKNFLSAFGASVLRGKEIAVIGPTTRKAAENLGLKVDVVPENSTLEGLIASMVEHEKT